MTAVNSATDPLLDLVRLAQQGDRRAFEQVFEHSYPTLYRFAFQWSGVVADAEDIAQLAAIKLAKSLGQFRFQSAFSTWLYRLVVNVAIDWARANKRHQGENPPEAEEFAAEGHQGFGQVMLSQLLVKIDSLGAGYKEAVILVLGEGCSHKEAAEILSVKESTVSWRIHQVRQYLAQQDGGSHE